MSDLKATVSETTTKSGHAGFHVEGYEKIEYDFTFIDGVFNIDNPNLAECYTHWGRCLAVTDMNIYNVYGKQMEKYFQHYNIKLVFHKTKIGEKAKTIPTFLSIVDSMTEFGIYRKEPVLVVGGGLVTDVAGFACAAYRRNTNFIRVPTTVIGLIDASVSIKVAVNYGNYKNRLGAYHAPIHTFLDFTFLRTLPTAQIRNGFAELIKISSCSHLPTFDLLDKYCEQLIENSFGRADGSSKELIDAADTINRGGIHEMLKLETPNLHEIGLDRVIAYGHTWSPLHELVPETPLRHGHAISIDMAYSATLANQRKLLSDEEHRRILNLFSRAGLSMDHHQFDEEILEKATAAILKTRDGKLRAAVPNPLGSCTFLNDVSAEEMNQALHRHKEIMKEYPRNGEGLEAFVDASDTGYTENAKMEEERIIEMAAKKAGQMNGTNGHTNGTNGHANGTNGHTNGTNGHANGTNGHTNGTNGHAPHTNGKANGLINGHSNGALSNGTTGNY
ncbi:putative 2-epi-5-epi-valiolone synthase protein [Botrytis fragariae]|uniref:Putative 2-epi-5-epi-valiolone synthase protein n=1 Tax=Botrytis fragariae TaxID=1964551 RepID=A0A8H6ARN8_9HELO|nr:putative 2-epi-5-epi-valiolone synthase protein [Botrytis fragariae]KAF5872346.1 putative 2-epi-5-epi-valiolone synthase protein [Botrytis fragariae]